MGINANQCLFVLAWVIECSTVLSSQAVQLTTKQLRIQEYLNAQEKTINQVLLGYDKRFIPTLPERPLEVKLKVEISDVLKLDEQEMECELILYIRQIWKDFRLSWNDTNNNISIKRIKVREHLLDKIWLPDIRISNLKEMNQFERFGGINMNIHSNGRVYYSQLALVKVYCPMDLRNYPMDQQICFLNFSSYAYSKTTLTFVLKKKGVKRANLPHFDFIEAKEYDVDKEKLTVKLVSIGLIFNRRSGHYILHIYVPSLSLVILSWLSFLMSPTDIANRLALVTTMLVSMVFLHSETNSSLPPVSYAKASDWFVLVSFVFILLTLLESSWVYRVARASTSETDSRQVTNKKTWFQCFIKQKEEDISAIDKQRENHSHELSSEQTNSREGHSSLAAFIDRISLFLFPLFYTGFNIFYWFYYMY